jgi:hypothetical protein
MYCPCLQQHANGLYREPVDSSKYSSESSGTSKDGEIFDQLDNCKFLIKYPTV